MNELQLPASDLWRDLAARKCPVVLYGMGNGADKILRVCDTYGIWNSLWHTKKSYAPRGDCLRTNAQERFTTQLCGIGYRDGLTIWRHPPVPGMR